MIHIKPHLPSNPSRAVEGLLGWVMVLWGAILLDMPSLMTAWADPIFRPMVTLAPQGVWADISILVGGIRLFGLWLEGRWRRATILRLIGAGCGVVWWFLILGCYIAAFRLGAHPYPLVVAYPVFIYYEAYSAMRCMEDARVTHAFISNRRARRWLRERGLPGGL